MEKNSNIPEATKEKKNTTGHRIVIGLLSLLLLLQTGTIFYLVSDNQKTKKTAELAIQAAQEQNSTQQTPRQQPRNALFPQHPAGMGRDPFGSMQQLEKHMSQIFSNLLAYTPTMLNTMDGEDLFDYTPNLDFEEQENMYLAYLDLPGLDKNQINITVRNNHLTVQGIRQEEVQKESQSTGVFAHERRYGSFSRAIPLPGPVDETKIEASYKNGVLTIKLPKLARQDNTKRISVI